MEKAKQNKKFPTKIAFVVLGLDISGGIAVILRHANNLIRQGFDVTLLNIGIPSKKVDWFHNEVPIINFKNNPNIGYFDIAIATHYNTVKFTKMMNSSRKIYFVQSDERRFDVKNAHNLIECEMSYRENFEYMTEAIWIQRWLKEEFGHDAYYVPNGLDPKMFYKTDVIKKKTKRPRILLEGPIDVEWKGVEDAYNAVKDLDCEIWIVSSYGVVKDGWRCDKFFYRVPLNEMKEIYSSCDIFLKMSRVEGFFGPPMEAMACGCAVIIGKVTGYDEYIVNDHNALIVEQGDIEGAKNAIERLINNVNLKKKLVNNGLETAIQWNWDRSMNLLEKVIKKETVEKYYREDFPERYDYNKVIKDIFIGLVDNNDMEVTQLDPIRPVNFNNLFRKSFSIIKTNGILIFTKHVYRYIVRRIKI